MRTRTALAAVLLLAACSTDPEPAAKPTQAPTSGSPSPSPTVSYDAAWKTGFQTEEPAEPLGKRSYTFTVGGTTGDRLRPGMWKTAGGPCDYNATGTGYGTGTATGRAYEISGGAWHPLTVTVDLPAGATLTVVHDGFLNGPGCTWTWEKPLG